MKIKEIGIDGFGKFHDYHTELSEGIQVIYGNNETGKTTLRQFMFHMLFGLKRAEGQPPEKMTIPDICRWKEADMADTCWLKKKDRDIGSRGHLRPGTGSFACFWKIPWRKFRFRNKVCRECCLKILRNHSKIQPL